MKAIVLHEYGGPDQLKWEDQEDPVPKMGEVLVRVAAAGINPIDWKMRSGVFKEHFPLKFPDILGKDVSGTVRAVGPGVTGFQAGDSVFAVASHTYAELCVVKASELAKVPAGLDLVRASALPLGTITGEQLIRLGTGIGEGQTILVTGANGGVGRSAVRTAKDAGAKVIAGVRKKQLEEAKTIHADQVIALDDEEAMSHLGFVHAIADTVGGKTAEKLLIKIAPGGVFASVVGSPNAFINQAIRIQPVVAAPDPKRMVKLALDVLEGRLVIPIDRIIPLRDAAKGQAAAEKGGLGKVLLLA